MLATKAPAAPEPVRIGLTPVFLNDRVSLLNHWRDYLAAQLERPVEFIQRTSYGEINDLLARGHVDAAWICGAPFLRQEHLLELVAVPLFQGRPLYRSYLIVPASDRSTSEWSDLRGKVFAYSDPDSNSGALYPRVAMREQGLEPDTLFRASFNAWGHRHVVEAVAAGLADAGAVDGYVWETLARFEPELTRQTRVVQHSQRFGFPPIVIRRGADEGLRQSLRRVLTHMEEDPRGAELLDALNLDGFFAGSKGLYDGIRVMLEQGRLP
ncbi:substrate-binding domain-containing protein [Arhodomonas sp. SL1]|uniref:substrate-binding domain-containing protein n=1 Tax=Arhodomonas sp. SL1 TaxID=3425691 RepID=UPI003F885B3B